ncbi:helix-turn-helix domain-containing protein [Paludibacterium purpuratum]|uniref:Putative transcriptional regulator n=1 Tax=Paludibacterium purpuratum TaxID=1144873 RepID=A0A4R7B1S2_9NEIS|nr:helix-turn-helix domain-containing protein [Paludibacterium purpuratum]TDR73598.1 putative transcriptional regulator [Paludibacterium purpuratum]
MDIEKIAKAIETDIGEALPELRQALAEAEAGIGRVTTPEQILLREARVKTGLSQKEFAQRINTPPSTLRDWEQGRFKPPGAVVCLMRLLMNHPELSNELASPV